MSRMLHILPEVLREKLGDDGAKALVRVINLSSRLGVRSETERWGERLERRVGETKADLQEQIARTKGELQEQIASTKAGLQEQVANTKADLEKQIVNVRTDLREQIGSTKTHLEKEIAETGASLRVQMANVKADIIKWTFIFWVGQLAAIYTMLRLMR